MTNFNLFGRVFVSQTQIVFDTVLPQQFRVNVKILKSATFFLKIIFVAFGLRWTV